MFKLTSKSRALVAPLALAAGAAAMVPMLASGAWFTDTQSVGNNTFSTGTVTLGTNPTSALVTVANLAPGTSTYAEMTVSNPGSLDFRYSLTQSTGTDPGALATVMDREVKVGAATCDAAGWAAATPASASAKMTSTAVFGNPDSVQTGTVGSVGADRVLPAGASEKLCFKFTLPTSVDNTFQGKTLTGSTLTFDAVQTKNN